MIGELPVAAVGIKLSWILSSATAYIGAFGGVGE